ncbi:MAG: TonB-dependent receptor [Gammaproteobacteria bacterium]|nr:TonB-dependent receptor [Gammaproteobacteria bacterium]
MRICHFLLLTAALSIPTVSVAVDITQGDTIIVTATRTPIQQADATIPVTVITREDIALSLATDLSELLRFQAGIDIGRNGGPGQATSVFMRGTESNHTLVLIDGVRMNPGTIGGAAVQNISPEMIERIEIVKGARSALFGTDAIGGVINVITRRTEQGFVEAGVGSGSFATQSGHVSAGNRTDATEFGINLDWQETDGYAPRIDSELKRGYENLSANVYASRRAGNHELSVRHWRGEGNVEYLDFFLAPVDQEYENAVTALAFESRPTEAGSSKLVLSFAEDRIQQQQTPDFVNSERLGLDWQYSHALENHTLTGGVYFVDEDASTLSFGSGFDERTLTRAIFLQDQLAFGQHRAFVALRLSDHESFGNHTTWNAEYAYAISDAVTLNLGLGHAFRAPDATDRFGFGGSPDLQPEIADEQQLGIHYIAAERHSFDVEFYANRIQDLIEYNFDTFTLQNLDEARIRGAQLGYEYRGERFVLRADLVKQRAENANTGERLLRRAEETATISFTQSIGTHRVGLSILATGERPDFGGVVLPGYVVANVTGSLQLNEQWQLDARIENLGDTEYQTAANYRMQERSGFVELRYRWQ